MITSAGVRDAETSRPEKKTPDGSGQARIGHRLVATLLWGENLTAGLSCQFFPAKKTKDAAGASNTNGVATKGLDLKLRIFDDTTQNLCLGRERSSELSLLSVR